MFGISSHRQIYEFSGIPHLFRKIYSRFGIDFVICRPNRTFSSSRAQNRSLFGLCRGEKTKRENSTFNRKKLCANIRFHQSFSALGIRCRQPVPEPVGSICRWRRAICLRKYGRRSASRNAVSQRRRNRVTRRWSKTRGRIYRVGKMRRFYLVAILLASVGCERIEPDQTQSPLRQVGSLRSPEE